MQDECFGKNCLSFLDFTRNYERTSGFLSHELSCSNHFWSSRLLFFGQSLFCGSVLLCGAPKPLKHMEMGMIHVEKGGP